MKYRLTGIVALIISLVYPVAGWQGPKNSNRESKGRALERNANALLQKGVSTLVYLKYGASEIDSAPDRVRVLLEIADAFWAVDPPQAQDIFKQSFEQAIEYEDSETERQQRAPDIGLRQMVITRIARRDPLLANKLLITLSAKTSTKESDAFGELYGRDTVRSEGLITAATATLPSDTKAAVQIAKLAALDGLSQGMRLFLLNLRSKDSNAANSLFEAIFNAACTRRPKDLAQALFLWDYAFQRETVYLGPVSWSREPTELIYPVDLGVKKRVLSFAVDAIIENAKQFVLGLASETEKPLIRERYVLLHSLASQLMPDMEKYLPSSLPILDVELRRLDQEFQGIGHKPPVAPDPVPQSPQVQDGINKLIERASGAYNTQTRDKLYARAVFRLHLHGEYERAIELARKIENPSLVLMLTEPIKFDRAGVLISRGELEAAAIIARSLETLELRVAVLTKVGAAYRASKKAIEAVEILNEAESVAAKASPSFYLASAILGISSILFDNDQSRAKHTISTAIRTINAVEEGDSWTILHSGGERSERLSVQNYNWSTRSDGGLNSISVVYPRIAGLLDVLAKISDDELEEGLLLARQLKRKGLSLAAQAIMCRRAIERAQTLKRDSPSKVSVTKGRPT